MKFLYGAALTRKIASLAAGKSPLKIAVANWGASALETIQLDTNRADLQVLCRLQDGRSAPSTIRALGKAARQSDRLNAKVVWTPDAAVVSSMDIASNGIPKEEHLAHDLDDAGILVEDAETLAAIEQWFEGMWVRSRPVSVGELRKAEDARAGAVVPEVVDLAPQDLDRLRLAVLVHAGPTASFANGASHPSDRADLVGRTLVAFRRGEDGRFLEPEILHAVEAAPGNVAFHSIPSNLVRFSLGRLSLSRIRSRLAKTDPLVSGVTVGGDDVHGGWMSLRELLG